MEAWREELLHTGIGTVWGKHKYVAREKVNGKWFYFYSLAAYEGWKKKNSKKTEEKKESRIPMRDYKDPKKSSGNKKKVSDALKKINSTSGDDKKSSKKSSGKKSSTKKTKTSKSSSKKSSTKATKGKKEKVAKEKKEKAVKEKTVKEVVSKNNEKQKISDASSVGTDFLKKVFSLKDSDIKTRIETDPVKLESLLTKNNEDGGFGYLVLNLQNGKTETVRWSKYNGKVTLKAIDSDTELSFAQLPAYTSINEIKLRR